MNDSSKFSAPIRGETPKAIDAALATLREHAGLDYEAKHLTYDSQLGVKRQSPVQVPAIYFGSFDASRGESSGMYSFTPGRPFTKSQMLASAAWKSIWNS